MSENRAIAILDRWFHRREIVNCELQPYLTRWYLFRSVRLSFFLHWFHRSDEDRALHDHPWSFITVILWPLMVCFRPAHWRHRVELVEGKPAWTFIIRFKERRPG